MLPFFRLLQLQGLTHNTIQDCIVQASDFGLLLICKKMHNNKEIFTIAKSEGMLEKFTYLIMVFNGNYGYFIYGNC